MNHRVINGRGTIGRWVFGFCGLLVLTGCNSGQDNNEPPPASSAMDQTPDEQQTRVPGSLASAVLEQFPIVEPDNPPIELPDDPRDLFRFLAQQQSLLQAATEPAVRLQIQTDRRRAADKLLTHPLGDQQRLLAVTTRLDSLMHLAAGGNTSAEKEFVSAVEELASDPDPAICEVAAIFQLQSELENSLTQLDKNVAPVVTGANVVARRFPDSPAICRELGVIADLLLDQGYRDQWLAIMENLVAVYGSQPDLRIQSQCTRMRSRIELARSGFDKIVNRLHAGEVAVIPEFEQLATQLLVHSELAVANSTGINRAIQWLELNRKPELAGQTNQIFRAVSANIDDPQLRRQVEAVCDLRATRLALSNRPLPSGLPVADGSTLDPAALTGRPGVVIFWSPAEPASVDLIKRVAAAQAIAGNQPWHLIGVCFSKKAAVTRTLFGGQLPDWPIVIDPGGSRDLAGEFGVPRAPHVMLLDETGVISATAVPAETLWQVLDQWSAPAGDRAADSRPDTPVR